MIYQYWKQALAVFGVIGVLSFAQTVSAQRSDVDSDTNVETDLVETDLTKTTCKDVMILSGVDRDTTVAFIHGFILGKSGDSNVNSEQLIYATNIFYSACLDKPNAGAIATMEASLTAVDNTDEKKATATE